MSYHNNNIPGSSQSTTNAQGQTAPPGYHYMPDGTLMSDAEHARLYSASPESSESATGCGIIATGREPNVSSATVGKLYYFPTISSMASNGSLIWNAWAPGSGSGTQSFMDEFDSSQFFTGPDVLWEVARNGNKIFQYVKMLNSRNQDYILELDFNETTLSASFSRLITLDNYQSILSAGNGSSATAVNNNTVALSSGNDVTTWDISGPVAYGTIVFSVPASYGYITDMVYDQTDSTWITIHSPSTNYPSQMVARWTSSGSLVHSHTLSSIPPNTYASAGCFCSGGEFHYAVGGFGTSGNVEIFKGTATGTLVGTFPGGSVYQGGAIITAIDAGSSPECCDASVIGIPGCTDPTAQNYNPLATIDDGSCIATVYGCTDPVALNYYPGANVDDGSCCYTSLVYDPTCNCAVCAGAGCTDPLATNYDPLATPDDGSCTYPPPVNPCDDPWTNTPGLVETCCDWCEENALIAGGLYGPPPVGCYDWMCDCCKPPIIKTLDLDLSDIPAAGERRTFTITGEGDGEVKFKLEVKDKDTGKYYNFVTNLFQTTEDSLEGTVTGGKYSGSITFPAVTGADDQYDIYLYAKPGTKHVKHSEARFGDNTLDINGSIGSNSLLMQKVIYQYAALTLTLHGFSPNATVSGTITTDTISIGRGQSKAKTPFSFTATTAATAAYRVLKQPVQSDVLAFVEPVIGATPVNLPGEDIYPAVSNTDTVNGAVTSGTTVTMDTAVASKMKVGDRVTGNAALNATTATVVSLDSTYAFTLSEAVAIADGLTLSFSNQMNFSWTVNNFANVIKEGMIIVPDTNVTSETSIGTYQDTITIFGDTVDEETIIQHDQPAVSTLGEKPTVAKGLVTVQAGQITFDKQQVLALGGDTLKIGGYGESEILRVHDWEVKFTDLAIALTAPTTTTTEATSAHATIAVADREGVINNVSTVSGIGIDSSAANPTLTTGGGLDGAGDWIMSAVQTLENGVTLTVENTGRVATITGNIEIIRAGTRDRTLRFDVEKLLSNS